MRSFVFLLIFSGIYTCLFAQKTPNEIYGKLFLDIQNSDVFNDSKTFVDCVPKKNPAQILLNYKKEQNIPLKTFVYKNFKIPENKINNFTTTEKNVEKHINKLWQNLKRKANKNIEGSSLISLPNDYIVPGGRFREIYYWDSYFTMLGLKESGEVKLIENMIDNFAFLINKFGHVPNGNRTYYISRSQPPFFSLMVELLASIKGETVYVKYNEVLQKEYDYWMQGNETIKKNTAIKRIVKLNDGSILNRYWDDLDIPRQEGFKEDVKTANEAVTEKMMVMRFSSQASTNKFKIENEKIIFKNLRAGACSGWDFSSRWFEDANKISTIRVLELLPVDLNALLYKLELVLAKSYGLKNEKNLANKFNKVAEKRMKLIENLFFSNTLNFYSDYDFATQKTTDIATAAAIFPLCFNTKSNINMGAKAKLFLEKYLLKDGGLICTPNTTGQQWDAPNGWAPLQWMAINGLEKNNQKILAKEIAKRWIKLNTEVFERTQKLMEKYNVVDTQLESGGGEYPSQDGFGWTNGVLLALIKKYGK